MAIALAGLGLAGSLRSPIGVFDEGLLLTNAWLVLEGGLPHRDFYTNYPPGIFLALAGLWKVFGVAVLVERILGFALHGALAWLAGKLAGRWLGVRFSFCAASAVLFWGVGLGCVPRAWLAAMVAAFGCAWLVWNALEKRHAWRFCVAGLALGVVGDLRHDLFGYIVLAALVFAAVRVAVLRDFRLRAALVPVSFLVLGALVTLIPVWWPVVNAAGSERVFLDLVAEQSRVLAARALPLFARSGWRGYQWMLLLEVAAPIVALILLARRGWSNGLALIGVLALAALPASLGRTDAAHVAGSAAPALVLFAVLGVRWFESRTSLLQHVMAAAVFLGALVVPAPRFLAFKGLRESGTVLGFERYGGLPETDKRAAGRADVLEYIRTHTNPGEPIFVGTRDQRVIFVNELDLYFLAERPGATRWLQFDPNLTNRLDIQDEIVADLERARPKVAVLCSCCFRDEGNGNGEPGAARLDEYLERNYATVRETGPYLILQRRP